MKVDLNSHFPHPVLSDSNDDFKSGRFDLSITEVRESTAGDVEIDYAFSQTLPEIRELLESGAASLGAFIRCQDTFYSELRPADGKSGTWRFDRGTLFGRVEVKPMIWLKQQLDSWNAESLNPEYGSAISMRKSEIIGLANDTWFNIGQEKLKKFESIFELVRTDEIPEGQLKLDLQSDVIRILAPFEIFRSIELMRGSSHGKPLLLSAVYLPVVMEVLENLRGEQNSGYESKPWYRVFAAKCEHFGIDIERAPLLESAQRLLASPVGKLGKSFKELTENA